FALGGQRSSRTGLHRPLVPGLGGNGALGISVSIGPGCTELQRILSLACWLAVTFVKMRMAPVLAAYAGAWCSDCPMPATEEMFTIEPPPARRIPGMAYFVPRSPPLALTAITWSPSAPEGASMATR